MKSEFLHLLAGVCVLVAQSYPIVCDLIDCSLTASSVHEILQARILNELPFPPPGDLPNPGIEPGSPALQADSLPSEPPGKPSLCVENPKLPSFLSRCYHQTGSFLCARSGWLTATHLLPSLLFLGASCGKPSPFLSIFPHH